MTAATTTRPPTAIPNPATATMTTAEATVATLIAHGLDTIYALPGVHNDLLFDALFKASDRIRTVHTRHEQGAAYMALGAALATGRTQAYSVVPGPGLLNSSAALLTAYGTNAPVLALIGHIPQAAQCPQHQQQANQQGAGECCDDHQRTGGPIHHEILWGLRSEAGGDAGGDHFEEHRGPVMEPQYRRGKPDGGAESCRADHNRLRGPAAPRSHQAGHFVLRENGLRHAGPSESTGF